MANPRRALEPIRPGGSRFLIAGAAVLIVLIGATAVAVVVQNRGLSSTSPAELSTTPLTRPTVVSSSTTPLPTPSSAAALEVCRAQVGRAEAVIAAASTGADHWSQHVQAQTDGNAGTIDVTEMNARFARTRALGPDDVTRYASAVSAYAPAPTACAPTAGAPAQLATCNSRLAALDATMPAAAAVMADWESHLKAMAASHEMHNADAAAIWDQMWRAAPKNIGAFASARSNLDKVPACG